MRLTGANSLTAAREYPNELSHARHGHGDDAVSLPETRAGRPHGAFPFAGYPPPEPKGPRRWTRFVAIAAVVIGAAYLTWRLLFTIAWESWWISVPLFLLEVHAYLGLLLFIPSTWDLDAIRPARRVTEPESRVAILIPTYNESVDILLPTLAAAIATRLPHETWVLDDGDRPAVKQLAEELGASYVTRGPQPR